MCEGMKPFNNLDSSRPLRQYHVLIVRTNLYKQKQFSFSRLHDKSLPPFDQGLVKKV